MTVIRLWSSFLTYFTVNAKLLGFEFKRTLLWEDDCFYYFLSIMMKKLAAVEAAIQDKTFIGFSVLLHYYPKEKKGQL